ncbi:MAG: helix-turn-helix transcriptional regulator [Clostridia bacterium]|nr:helix-turn-helix transcriptional regulator [Clostridia bacterium]
MKKIEFNNNKNIISEQVKLFRKQKGLSQADLSTRLQLLNVNIDQQMISKIEQNKRQVTDYELACICHCLSVTPDELLSEFIRTYFK